MTPRDVSLILESFTKIDVLQKFNKHDASKNEKRISMN